MSARAIACLLRRFCAATGVVVESASRPPIATAEVGDLASFVPLVVVLVCRSAPS